MNSDAFSPQAHALTMRKAGFWLDRPFDDYLAAAVAAAPGKTAIVADGASGQKRISFAGLEDLVARSAASLIRLGLRCGDIVAVQSPNYWEAIVLALACLRTGIVFNPLMPIFREHELSFMLGFAEVKALVVPEHFGNYRYAPMAEALKQKIPSLKHVIVMRGDGPNAFDAVFLSHDEKLVAGDLAIGVPPADELAVLMFTSGTTGSPKGVMHTVNTLTCCIDNIARRGRFTSDDVLLVASPIGHMIGLLACALLALRLGATMVLLESWNARRAVELIVAEGVTYSAGPAPFLSDLLEASAANDRKPEGLRLFLCAGAPIPPVLIERASRELGLRVVSVWGMTETLANTMTEVERAFEKSSTTDGRALDGSEVKVVDSEGRIAPLGTVGRLMVRGAQTLIGYYKRPDIELFDAEGFMDTGDLALMDSEGYIRISGRTKDVIIRGGENVPVADIENVLFTHPAVLAVAVVGYPDARLGERACAFVQTRPGQSFDFAEMQAFLASKQVARQFWPERLELQDALPRTPSGKIQKFPLRDMAKSFGNI